MVTGSDDFTMFLWQPSDSKKQIARMTGLNFVYILYFIEKLFTICFIGDMTRFKPWIVQKNFLQIKLT